MLKRDKSGNTRIMKIKKNILNKIFALQIEADRVNVYYLGVFNVTDDDCAQVRPYAKTTTHTKKIKSNMHTMVISVTFT